MRNLCENRDATGNSSHKTPATSLASPTTECGGAAWPSPTEGPHTADVSPPGQCRVSWFIFKKNLGLDMHDAFASCLSVCPSLQMHITVQLGQGQRLWLTCWR